MSVCCSPRQSCMRQSRRSSRVNECAVARFVEWGLLSAAADIDVS